MKYFPYILIIFLSLSGFSQNESHDWEVNLGSNYFWGGNIYFVQGELTIENSASFDIGISRNFGFNRSVGLTYSYVPTQLKFYPNSFHSSDYSPSSVNMDAHFIYTSAKQYFPTGSVFSPYVDGGFGLAIYNIKESGIRDRTQFLLNFALGTKIEITDNFGIQLGGGVKLPFYNGGTGLYCGIGGYSGVDCGLSFVGSVLVAHWELGGGIVYSF